MSDMGTRLFIKAALQKQQKGLPDDLFRLFTGIGKNTLDVNRSLLFYVAHPSRHHSKKLEW